MRAYSITQTGASLTAAITAVTETTVGATKALIITRATLSQQSNTTSAQQAVQILRQSTAGTNVVSPVATPADAGDTAYNGTVRGMCTTLGTAGVILYPDSFNWQNGWLYLPVPEERYTTTGAGIVALKVPVAPAALTVNSVIDVLELS
jgi:outer membrane receptor protein involved in Fe transport